MYSYSTTWKPTPPENVDSTIVCSWPSTQTALKGRSRSCRDTVITDMRAGAICDRGLCLRRAGARLSLADERVTGTSDEEEVEVKLV